ncbi:TetR/AcrR family transcriptional regulator [Ruania suaedae]|uniref:TetR/AcrR family transcriptional regulator n=1 Tax=Ruania suaedae TaxID=2897774 RepID=UPI001E37B2BE|nr:TetR/AcrR family transcriptional regulator [Ruania suaedae]UFU01938.1 TetR/AcrR family transcriptional regulator [Ruania suaedae]
MRKSSMGATRSRRAGGARRAQVLEHVVEVLSERGYAATRFTDVAQASGVAVSTLQGYFGSREDMLIEALQGATTGEVEVLARLADGFTDPWQQLVALVDRGLSTPVPTWRMLMEFWTAAAHDPELRDHAAVLAEQYRQPFRETVQRGVDAGVFSPRSEVTAIVDVVVATMDGFLYPLVLGHLTALHPDHRAVVLDQLAFMLGTDS